MIFLKKHKIAGILSEDHYDFELRAWKNWTEVAPKNFLFWNDHNGNTLHCSHTGSRTRAAWVKARNPNR